MRKIISGLFHGSKPALAVAVLVAAVGVTGTAYAGKSGGSGSKGDSKQSQTWKKSDKGDKNDKGNKGSKGDKDPKGPNWGQWGHAKGGRVAYGVATVNVSRGGAPATAWATYSTALGSPVGDNTGGVFRFTCATAMAPCTVSVGGAVLSRSAGSAAIYPRILIYRQDYNAGGPEVYCEYGDGSTGAAPLALTKQPLSSTPTYTPVQVNIGGTADCSGPVATAGDVNQITVPAGYYDVHSTFVFLTA
jgi:hypothetical protein